jgi:hypothetical protein
MLSKYLGTFANTTVEVTAFSSVPIAGVGAGSVVSNKPPDMHALVDDMLVTNCTAVIVICTVVPDGAINLDQDLPPCPHTLLLPAKLLSKYRGDWVGVGVTVGVGVMVGVGVGRGVAKFILIELVQAPTEVTVTTVAVLSTFKVYPANKLALLTFIETIPKTLSAILKGPADAPMLLKVTVIDFNAILFN